MKNQKLIFAPWNCNDKQDYPYQNFYLPMKKLFKDIIFFDPRSAYFNQGKDKMNSGFLRLIKAQKPDYVFMLMIYDEFYLSTIKKIKEISPNTKIINFFTDDEVRFEDYTKYFSEVFDICITTYPTSYKKAISLGLKNFYLIPYSCNTDIFKKMNLKKKYDVSFIGQPASRERREYLKFLIKSGVNVSIWGKNWENLPDFNVFKAHYKGVAEDMVKIINESKIVLNFLMDDSNKQIQIKGRITEVAGCGTFQLATFGKDILELFGKEDIVMFKSPEDLLDKIKFYLQNDKIREKIARNAHKKVISRFNWDSAFKKFFGQADRISKKESKTRALIISNKSDQKSTDSINFLNPSKLSKKELISSLKFMKEDFLIILDKKQRFLSESMPLYSSAFKESDVLVSDLSIKNSFGEIFVLRTDCSRNILNFPTSCFSFKSDFVKKNPEFIISLLKDKRHLAGIKQISKLSFPTIESSPISLSSFNNDSRAVSRKFELIANKYLHSHRYFTLSCFLLLLSISSIFRGNLFILSYLIGDIAKFFRN